MAAQYAAHSPLPAAKALAAHPVFPLSPLELQRWNRFARKGGIGHARARVDKVSQDAVKDLMFLEGDDIVILMDLGSSTYLGFCEGVVGLFSGPEVVMQQAKLKRPVISSRPSGSSTPAPPADFAPPPPPRRQPPMTDPSPLSAPQQPAKTLPRMASDESLVSSSGRGTPRSRRKPIPEVEVLDERCGDIAALPRIGGSELRSRRRGDGAGLGIAVRGVDAPSRGAPGRRSDMSAGEPQEILATTQSPNLPGAFASPSFPSTSRASSVPRGRYAVSSPAPSSASTATTRTPSLITSPYSDFADRDRDDESISSMSGHGHMPAHGPLTPYQGAGAWDPAIARHGAGNELPRAAGLVEDTSKRKDSHDGPTPTTESFPLEAFPMPAFGELSMREESPTPFSSPDEQLRGAVSFGFGVSLGKCDAKAGPPPPSKEIAHASEPSHPARRPSHALSPSGVPVPFPSPHLQSAFSFSPNSSIASSLPPSILSATDLQYRREGKSSDSSVDSSSTSGRHVPGTPTDDPTLAFIFDSYRYSMAQPGEVARMGDSPARSLLDLRYDAMEELDEPASPPEDASASLPALRGFGAASQLRSRLAGAPTVLPPEPQHVPLASTSAVETLDDVRIPRVSEIFPRSGTHDSLASWASGTSGSQGAGAGPEARFAMWAPATPTKDWSPRRDIGQEEVPHPAPSQRRQSKSELRAPLCANRTEVRLDEGNEHTPVRTQRLPSVPVSDAAHLEQDLAASRRLFHAYFSPPQELVAAAAQHQKQHGRFTSLDASPAPVSPRHDSPERFRRKSIKGLQISSPVVPGVQMSPPVWRSPDGASPIEQALPRLEDVFVASPTSLRSMPQVEVSGASPSAAAREYTSRRVAPLEPPPALSPVSIYPDSLTSPTTGSPQTLASAASSPATPSFDEHERTEGPCRAGSGTNTTNKLRKPIYRAKSSPSLGRQHGNMSSVSNPPAPPMPSRQPSDPFVDRPYAPAGKPTASLASSKESNERRVDYSAGISSKDFEEETVQIGRSEFEIVKPHVALLAQSSEDGPDDDRRAAHSIDVARPSTSSARPDDLVTPRRPLPPPHSTTDYSRTPSHTLAFSQSTVSLSHFSPPTPASVEHGGRGALDDYRNKEAKWIAALASMTPQAVRKSKKMRALVQAGVPSSVRGKVWAFLAEADVDKRQGVYQTLCESDGATLAPAIEQDLSATLDHPQFAEGSAGRADIFHVLQAFARFDPKLGYYPGLGSVVGLLLTQMPAEDAFWTLVSLVQNYGLRQYFPASGDELRLETLAFELLSEAMEPKLAKRMRDFPVSPADYLAVWQSTLYLSVLSQATVLRLVDLLLFDSKTRYRIPLALLDLSHLEDRLSFPSRDAVLNHLLAPPPTAFTPALLVPAVATMKVSDDKLKKAHAKAAKALKG